MRNRRGGASFVRRLAIAAAVRADAGLDCGHAGGCGSLAVIYAGLSVSDAGSSKMADGDGERRRFDDGRVVLGILSLLCGRKSRRETRTDCGIRGRGSRDNGGAVSVRNAFTIKDTRVHEGNPRMSLCSR